MGALKGSSATVEPHRPSDPVEAVAGRAFAIYAASALSLLSALIHLWATPEHFQTSWWGYGAFFVVTALAQGTFAIVLLRWRGELLCVAGILGNIAIVAMYVVTRTSGIPIGPEAAMIEDPGVLDMTSTVAEVGLVIALLAMLGDVSRKWMINALFLAGIVVWVLKFTGVIY